MSLATNLFGKWSAEDFDRIQGKINSERSPHHPADGARIKTVRQIWTDVGWDKPYRANPPTANGLARRALFS